MLCFALVSLLIMKNRKSHQEILATCVLSALSVEWMASDNDVRGYTISSTSLSSLAIRLRVTILGGKSKSYEQVVVLVRFQNYDEVSSNDTVVLGADLMEPPSNWQKILRLNFVSAPPHPGKFVQFSFQDILLHICTIIFNKTAFQVRSDVFHLCLDYFLLLFGFFDK